MEKFNYMQFIEKMISFSPRQFKGEDMAAKFIINTLEKNNITYSCQPYSVYIPRNKKSLLKAAGKEIKCDACSFVSGKISSNDCIISSLISPTAMRWNEAITFNPKSKAISNSNHYFFPAISISREKLNEVTGMKKVTGEVIVEKVKKKSLNILVGNKKNPRAICFAHYDSVRKGAIDNASGVSVMMSEILANPKSFQDVLYVFSGNEELSFDNPIYWGYGYRAFEKKYVQLLKKTKKIIVVDCVGHCKTVSNEDYSLMKRGFPIKNLHILKNKTCLITGDNLDILMTVYHSDIDDGRYLKVKYLEEAKKLLNATIQN